MTRKQVDDTKHQLKYDENECNGLVDRTLCQNRKRFVDNRPFPYSVQ